jgi:proteic killer suppression protein
MAIASFRHKGLRRLWQHGDRRGVPSDAAPKIRRILTVLNRITEPGDMAVYPGWRLHRLTGDLEGLWSVTVTGNRRIIFRFEQGRALDVDLIDYH